MKTFLKSKEVSLKNGGYLTGTKGKKSMAIGNSEFVAAQKRAEYFVTFAELAKGKNFKQVETTSFAALKGETLKLLSEKSISYIEKPKKPALKITNQLRAEAMEFMSFEEESEKSIEINEMMQKFNILKEFEEHGLYFDEEIVKLNKLYSVEEILSAVKYVTKLV